MNSSVHMCRKKTWKRNLVFRITASLWKNKHPGLCEQVPFMLAGIFLNMTHVFSRMCIVPKSFGGSHKSPTTEWHPCLIPAAAVKFSRTVCFRSNMGQMCKTEGKKTQLINDAAQLHPCSLSHLNILSILGTCVADSVPFQIQPATFSMSYYKSEVL